MFTSLSLYIESPDRLVQCLVAALHDSRDEAGATNGPVPPRCLVALHVASPGVYGWLVTTSLSCMLHEGLPWCPGYVLLSRDVLERLNIFSSRT